MIEEGTEIKLILYDLKGALCMENTNVNEAVELLIEILSQK